MTKSLDAHDETGPTGALAQSARETVDAARQHANQTGEDAKNTVADHVQSAANATEAAREELRPDLPVDPIMDTAVEALSQAAQHLRHTDISTLAQEAGDFAKRNPALVLGGAALIGFAAARFLKAGPAEPPSKQSADPWTDQGGTG